MAKKNDQRAGGFETENTGGVLSGLLADEEHLDRRAMFRLGTWGVASVGAVIIAVLANQSSIKTRRDDAAALDLTRQSQQIQSVARESQNETRRLASAIDTLNGDRDRLYSRLTTIEQGLDSVTGAIAKQNAAPPATPPSAAPPTAIPAATPPSPAPTPQPVAQTAAPDPAPAVAPVATTVAPVTTTAAVTPAPEKPRAEAKKPAPPATVAAATPAPATPSTSPTPSPPAPLMASKSLMAPPDAAAAKLIEPEPSAKAAATPPPSPPEPVSTASAPTSAPPPAPAPDVAASKPAPAKVAAAEPAPTTAPTPLAVKRTEFGVDVGGANSVAGLRALWRGLLKSRSNAPLAALQPLIVVKERDNGLGMQLRLVAGPLGDAAAAAKICARIAENERPCETTVFDGQRLALKADDTPATTESIAPKPEKPATERSSPDKPGPEAAAAPKPAPEKPAAIKPGSNKYSRHRGYYASKRAAVVEDPPKQPETSSSISSFFSSRIHPQ